MQDKNSIYTIDSQSETILDPKEFPTKLSSNNK